VYAANKLLSKPHSVDSSQTFLKKFSPLFDEKREKMGNAHLWVQLLRFPPQHWFEDVFRHIGNHLGTFVDAYPIFSSHGEDDNCEHVAKFRHLGRIVCRYKFDLQIDN